MIKRYAPILTVVLALAVTPATALGDSNDGASTRAYIRADYALQLASKASLPAAQAAANGLIGQVNSQCPDIMAGAPRNNETTDVGGEILGSVLVALSRPEDKATTRFAQAVAGLRWSNRKLTRMVKSYAIELKAQAGLAMPNLCADLKAWVASGYTTLPASATRFVQQVDAIITGPGPGKVPLKLFTHYERPDEKTIIHHIDLLEAKNSKSQVAILGTTLSQISRALGQSS